MKENEGSRNRTLLMVMAIVALIAIVGGATFAFFASTQDINANLAANITTASKTYTFIASADGEINFHLSAQDMSESNVNENYIMTDNGLINVEVASANDEETTICTYDIAWVWDSDNKYTTPDVVLPYTKDGITYPYELSISVDGGEEKDLSSYTLDSNNSFIITTGLQTIAINTTPVIDSHKIEVKAYNIPVDQQNLFNKSFQAHLKVVNNNCIAAEGTAYHQICNDGSAACSIAKLYTEDGVGGLYYHDGKGTYTNVNLEAGDNSYRYSGTDPNNYLCFKEGCTDDEKFRIIGVIDNKVKVIKITDINSGDTIAWNSTKENTWGNSTIETYLNGEYLINLKNVSNLDTDKLIDITTWQVGGMELAKIKSPNTVKDTYIEELSSTPTIERKIGLMYISDYGYAAEPTYWSTALFDYELSKGHDWMPLSDYPWTISRYSGYSDTAFFVNSDGRVSSGLVPSTSYGTCPTFSLSSSVKLKSGTGTSSDPYIVGL